MGWCGELRNGLGALPDPTRHVVLLLDDFLVLAPIDGARAQKLISEAETLSLPYLRLKPVERCLLAAFAREVLAPGEISSLDQTEPYYSSLQVAVWRRDHLQSLLARECSIWEFERVRCRDQSHYAVSRKGPIRYVHVVERGKWMPYAATAFRISGVPFNPGKRPAWHRLYLATHLARKLRFALFGYAPMRLKAWMTHARPPSEF